MTLSEEIRAMMDRSASGAVKMALQSVLDMLSERGRSAGLQAKDKVRGDSAYYKKLAKKRWK
jgi:hypothetical protein